MRLYIDLDFLQLVEAPGFRNPVTSIRLKRGDGAQLELQFCQGGTVVALAEDVSIKFAAKKKGDYTGPFAIESDNFASETISEPTYTAAPGINANLLNSLLRPENQPELSEVTLMAEITWRLPQALPTTTKTFDLVVENDVVKDDVTFYGKFTAIAFNAEGESIIRTVIRTSRLSQAEADELAKAAAIALVNHVSGGGDDPERYLYEVRNHEERLLKVIYLPGRYSDGKMPPTEVGRITENRYGAEVLNAFQVMFVDVDTQPENPVHPNSNEDKSTAPLITEAEADALLDQFCVANPTFGFRVYKTFAGLRYLCTSGLFDASSALVKDVLTQLNADQSYRVLCRIQKCFRARLTPKPWRASMSTATFQFARKMNFSEAGYLTFRQEYLSVIPNFATCHYLRTVGNPGAHPECVQVMDLHDARTNAASNLPLA